MVDFTPRQRPVEIMTERDIREATVGEPVTINGPVRLVQYNPDWPVLYAREEARIRAALGDRVHQLEHIGSTSVPGLIAKPIIDMQLLVENAGDESTYAPDLIAAGYTLRIREPDWNEHRVFKGTDPDVNLHLFARGSSQARRHLAFRDRLRGSDEDRDLYARTKQRLTEHDWTFVQNYADAKNDVVDEILSRAGVSLSRDGAAAAAGKREC